MFRKIEIVGIILGLLLAIPVIFTTASCVFWGSYCEYAIIGPTERGMLTKNLQELNASEGNGAILRAEEQKTLISGSRLDVYGRQGELTKLIGSSSNVNAYSTGRDAKWTLVFSNLREDKYKVALDIELYVVADGFEKRTFTLVCDAYLEKDFRILNPTYVGATNAIEFDVVSDCQKIVANGILELSFGGRVRSGHAVLKLNSDRLLVQVLGSPVSATQ